MKQLIISAVILLMIAGCQKSIKNDSDILYDICKKGNLFEIYRKDKLTFTFNVRLPDKTVQRDWEWHIKTKEIYLNGVKQNETTHMFVNDIYWLLFPLKAYEDSGQYQLTVHHKIISPISHSECSEITIKYNSGQGFTPDDTYKLYVDNSLKIIEWAYLKGSQEPPARMTTWTDYRDIGGITLSLLREGGDNFKVWFTGVSIE